MCWPKRAASQRGVFSLSWRTQPLSTVWRSEKWPPKVCNKAFWETFIKSELATTVSMWIDEVDSPTQKHTVFCTVQTELCWAVMASSHSVVKTRCGNKITHCYISQVKPRLWIGFCASSLRQWFHIKLCVACCHWDFRLSEKYRRWRWPWTCNTPSLTGSSVISGYELNSAAYFIILWPKVQRTWLTHSCGQSQRSTGQEWTARRRNSYSWQIQYKNKVDVCCHNTVHRSSQEEFTEREITDFSAESTINV